MLKKLLLILSPLPVVLAALPALADVALGPRISCSEAGPAVFIGVGVFLIALAALFFTVRRAAKRRSEGGRR